MNLRMVRVGKTGMILSLSLLAGVSCASLNAKVKNVGRMLKIVDEPGPRLPKEAPPRYRTAVQALEKQRFQDALDGLQEFLMKEPTSQWTQAALLNKGRALQGLERWSEAADVYRSVARNTLEAPQLQALALYYLSFCLEATGEDREAVAALNDVVGRVANLPKEIAQAELPARMAAAYARVGNFEKALELYRQAESGIRVLKRSEAGKETPQWLAKTFYFMGHTTARYATWDDFEIHLRPLGRAQVYLLEAAEAATLPWAKKAADDLIEVYQNLWRVIETAPAASESDPLLAQRALQEKQWERAILVQESLKELKARFLLETQDAQQSLSPNLEAKRIHQFVDSLEKQITKLFEERPAGEGLTVEARMRRESVRGRVVSPDSSLEQMFLKGGRDVNVFVLPTKDEKK